MTVTDFDADERVQPLKRSGGGRYSTSDKVLAGAGVLLAAGAAFFPWYVFLNPGKFSVPALWEGKTRDLPETAAKEVMSVSPAAMIDNDNTPPLEGVEVKIAPDGELLVRGELVMHGYWRNEEETARVLKDGWLHTGDIGLIDEKGRIKITDRKKDIIVNDKGDNVAPQKVEGMLTLQPEIVQAMIAGVRKPYMTAVLVPDPEWTQEWCAKNGAKCDFKELAHDPDYKAALGHAVERVNKELSVIERIRKFILADGPFTIENEQLTPSLKIRRHVLKQVYGERLDALY